MHHNDHHQFSSVTKTPMQVLLVTLTPPSELLQTKMTRKTLLENFRNTNNAGAKTVHIYHSFHIMTAYTFATV